MNYPPGTIIRNTTAARINHWITAGPNEVQPEDDIAAAKLIRESDGQATGVRGSGHKTTGDVA